MGLKVRGLMSLVLIAVRYDDPDDEQDDIHVYGNYLSRIPDPFLRPLLRCLMQNGRKMDSGPFTAEEAEKARPLIAEWSKALQLEEGEEVPHPKPDMKKWY